MNPANTPLFPHYADDLNGDDLASRFNLLRPQMKWADTCLSFLQNNDSGYINVMNTPAATRKRAADPWLENVRAFLATTEAGLRHIGHSLDLLLHAFGHTQMFADQAKQTRGYTMLQRSKAAWNNVWRQFVNLIHNTCQKIDLVCLSENAALHHHRLSEILPPGEVLRHVNLRAAEKKQMFWEAMRLWDTFKLYPRESEAYSETYRQLVRLTWRVRGGHGIQEGHVVEEFQTFAHSADPRELNQVAAAAVPGNVPGSPGGFRFTQQTSPTTPYEVHSLPNPFQSNPRTPSIGPTDLSLSLGLSRLNQPVSTDLSRLNQPVSTGLSRLNQPVSIPSPYSLSIPPDQFHNNRRPPTDSSTELATSPNQVLVHQIAPLASLTTFSTAPSQSPSDEPKTATRSPRFQSRQSLHGGGLQSPFRPFQQAHSPQLAPTPLDPLDTSQQSSAQYPQILPSHASNAVPTHSASAAVTQASTPVPNHPATNFVREAATSHLPPHDYLVWERYSQEDFLTYQNLSTPMNGIELDTTLEDLHR